MRFSTFSTIAALAATTLAQDLSSLPSCGTTCVGNGLAGTGCSQIDVACICKSSAWISQLSCCVSQACQPADQQKIITFAQQICAPVGVTNLPTSAGCTGSVSATASASASASGAASSASAQASSAASSASAAISSGLGAISSAAASASKSASAASGNGAAAPTAFALPMGVAAAAGLFAAAL